MTTKRQSLVPIDEIVLKLAVDLLPLILKVIFCVYHLGGRRGLRSNRGSKASFYKGKLDLSQEVIIHLLYPILKMKK